MAIGMLPNGELRKRVRNRHFGRYLVEFSELLQFEVPFSIRDALRDRGLNIQLLKEQGGEWNGRNGSILGGRSFSMSGFAIERPSEVEG